jgi:hypothetical protein
MNSVPLSSSPRIAFGPEMPGWGSWDWVGADLCRHLATMYRTTTFAEANVPECEVCVIVKHPLPADRIAAVAERSAVIYCPVDAFGSASEIDSSATMLHRCSRIVIHAERLRKYFAPYAPVEFIDHHCKFTAPLRERYHHRGELLWVGVRSNLPALVEWVNRNSLPAPLRVLTNPENTDRPLHAKEFGFRKDRDVRIETWSPESFRRRALECRAALDIKGSDFRSRHKPPAKAIDFIASGIPIAMNPDSAPAEHLARLGFPVVSPLDVERWLSREYWQETLCFGAAIRELLSLERIGLRWRRLIDELLACRLRD